MGILSKHIYCARTLELIQKSLGGKVLDRNGKITKTTKGTPEGSLVSPILSKIVLHELDKFIERYNDNFLVGRNRAVKAKYQSLNSVRNNTNNAEFREKKLALMMDMKKDTQDPNLKRLLYVRYGDDFVILLICSLQEAFTLKRSLKDFVKSKLGLELNLDKTTIESTRKGFNFLGASLRKVDQVVEKRSVRNKSNQVVRKRSNRRLVINAPLKKLVDKLLKNKFAKKNHLNQVIATSRKDLVNHSHFYILNFYNLRIRGILNFYSFAGNYSSLSRIV